MNQPDIIKANRASELEQLEQDERNEHARADMKADELVNARPPKRPQFYREADKEDILFQIEGENVNGTQPGRG